MRPLEHAIAAPFCTRQLADLGTRVIKIERPGVGDFARAYDTRVHGQSSHFVWTNRSKESLTLDLKHAEAPGVLAKLLLLIQSEAGLLSITGSPNEPAKAGCSIADIAAGMYAYANILAALIQRGKTGRGCRIDVSMLESMVEWMGYPLYYAFEGAAPPPRAGASHATICPYGPFTAGDGRTVVLGLQNEREWTVFCCKVLRRPELAADARFDTNARRVANKPALQAIIDKAFGTLNAEQLVARLEGAQIANANVSTMADVWAHAQLHVSTHASAGCRSRRRPGRSRRCCRPACRPDSRRAWTRYRRSASTPTRSSPSSAVRQPTSRACVPMQ